MPVACGIRKKRTRREVVDNNIYDILSLMPFLSPVVLYRGYLRNSCFGMIEECHPKSREKTNLVVIGFGVAVRPRVLGFSLGH